MVGSTNVGFKIRLESLRAAADHHCSYDPEIFAGLHFRMQTPKLTLVIFSSGKVVLMGAKRREHLDLAIKSILPLLSLHW